MYDYVVKFEKVEITATQSAPARPTLERLGIEVSPHDDFTFEQCTKFGWAYKYTNLDDFNVHTDYRAGRYRFTKVNDIFVNNRNELNAAIEHLKEGEPIIFTIEQPVHVNLKPY